MAIIEKELQTLQKPLKKHRLMDRSGANYFKNKTFKFYSLLSALMLGIILLSIIVFIGKTGLLVFKDVSFK